MRSHYNTNDLRKALSQLPIEAGDMIFTHNNIGFFGRPENVSDSNELCEIFFDEIMAVLGERGTLVVPAFTYSFPRKEVFDPFVTTPGMGMFAEWIQNHTDSIRSEDPCYSVSAIGHNAISLVDKVPENSFGDNSFFDRFFLAGGKILNMNFDAGSTFIHFFERKLSVPYRFDKTFNGNVKKDGKIESVKSTIWVRYLSDDALEYDSKPFDKLAREKGIFKTMSIGRGQIGLISLNDTYKCINETITERPWFLTKAESLGIVNPVIISE